MWWPSAIANFTCFLCSVLRLLLHKPSLVSWHYMAIMKESAFYPLRIDSIQQLVAKLTTWSLGATNVPCICLRNLHTQNKCFSGLIAFQTSAGRVSGRYLRPETESAQLYAMWITYHIQSTVHVSKYSDDVKLRVCVSSRVRVSSVVPILKLWSLGQLHSLHLSSVSYASVHLHL